MNRWSFDSPSVAIDLKKLQLGNSEEDDFVPNRTEQNKGFSSDMVGMEVVSACFGGFNASEESAWSSMTLWIAMKDGDVYALCPLLPSKWQSSQTSIAALSTTLVSQSRLPEDREDSAQGELRCQREQYLWISDIDGQDPVKISEGNEFGPQVKVYNRPSQPGPIPRLQGPFQIYNDDSEEDLELADIHVIAARVDREELLIGEDYDSEVETSTENGLSISIICLMTRSGRIHMCLDLDGVEGEWLPQKKVSQSNEIRFHHFCSAAY